MFVGYLLLCSLCMWEKLCVYFSMFVGNGVYNLLFFLMEAPLEARNAVTQKSDNVEIETPKVAG